MEFFDLHIHSAFSEGMSSIEQIAQTAKMLGYSGFCFSAYYKNEEQIKRLYGEIEKVKQKIDIEIFLGFEARNPKELDILSQKRKRFDILLARGGDANMNRVAVETSEVDILTHPELDRIDSGLNHTLMKLANKNNVAIEINFREILFSNKKSRSKILQNIRTNVLLTKKFKTPIIVCSGATSHLEMKDPYCLISIAQILGLNPKEGSESVSKVPKRVIEQTRERGKKEWIRPGVKVIK